MICISGKQLNTFGKKCADIYIVIELMFPDIFFVVCELSLSTH